MKIQILHHASIRLEEEKVFYFDPYQIEEEVHDADYIFITHDHYDHYDVKSIENVKNSNTKIIVPKCLEGENHTLVVFPNQEYTVDDFSFTTVPAYNIYKDFHPKNREYVGYNILLHGMYYYIMGDTDRTPECDGVKTDVCFVPIGGVYTMDFLEAASYINDLKPKMVFPIHYGFIVGDSSLGMKFMKKINKDIQVKLEI